MKRTCLIVLVTLLIDLLALAQVRELKVPDTLKLDGVPKFPASLGDIVRRYQDASPDSLVGWDPVKVEPVFIRHPSHGGWELDSVGIPGGPASRIRYLPAGAYGAYHNPRRNYFVFDVDTTPGAERIQLFGFSGGLSPLVLLSDGKSKNYSPAFSNSGDQMMYSSNRRNGKHMDIYVLNPLDPTSNRMVAQVDGEDWSAFDWSPDDKKVILSEYLTSGETHLWILDIATQTKTRLTDPSTAGPIFNGSNAQFSKDGKGVYHTTDRDSEFRRLAYVDIATRRYTFLTPHLNWDVEDFALSRDRRFLAFITNDNGSSSLHVLDTAKKNREIRLPEIPSGVIQTLSWHNDDKHLAFGLSSGTIPGDIYSIEIGSAKLQRWTNSSRPDTPESPKAEQIEWKSFDGKLIPGFLYRPPPTFQGRRPVIISAHGGPNSQFRPSFRGSDNYFTFEIGAVMIYTNIRGSNGYGKAFLESDNGYLRQDSIKDIGALLDWIRDQPELDPNQVLIRGQSYGGYVALSVAADYCDRVRGAISISGPSNLVTYLQKTDLSRQDRRRAEYGDERDPKMREYLESIAPFYKADRVKKPLLVIQGRYDTRVDFSESEQMVAAVRKFGTPVWYLLALDEGHDFGSARNIHFFLCTQAFFVRGILSDQVGFN